MYRSYKFRLYPNKAQIEQINKNFLAVRFVWNKTIEHAQLTYKDTGKFYLISARVLKSQYPWLAQADSIALCQVWTNLKLAYKRFFALDNGYPKFKTIKDTRSYFTKKIKIVNNNLVSLPKIKLIKFKQHRQFKDGELIKSCTVSKYASGKYYINILVAGNDKIVAKSDNNLSLDVVINHNGDIVIDGKIINYPSHDEAKLANLKKSLLSKKPYSNNREKARIKFARAHEKVVNRRNDFLHKLSNTLANNYDVVNFIDNRQVVDNKKSADQAIYKFKQYLQYKLKERGKQYNDK